MSRDVVALVVTVEVHLEAWEATYGKAYEVDDVVEYVRARVASCPAVTSYDAMSPQVNVRLRRQPKEGKA